MTRDHVAGARRGRHWVVWAWHPQRWVGRKEAKLGGDLHSQSPGSVPSAALGARDPALLSARPYGFAAPLGPLALCLPPLGSYGNVVWYLVAEIKRLNWDLGHLGPFTKRS